MKPTSKGRGFALAELGAVIAIVAVTAVVAAVTMRRERAAMWDAADAENLQRFAAATTEYASDNGDTYWSFSWRRGTRYSPDFPPQDTDVNAAVCQAVEILHRKAGRNDITTTGLLGAWLPHPFYSHLVLYDYLDQDMPALWGVCPADRNRLEWAKDPAGFDQGALLPCQPQPINVNKRWPYSSSYEMSTSFFDQSATGNRIYQGGADNLYFIPSETNLYGKLLGDTAFPSQKVHLFEGSPHHVAEGSGPDCDPPRTILVPQARTAMLFADGHAAWSMTGDANPGWQPNNPTSHDPTFIQTEEGVFPGVYRWTRNFLAGRDFGGPEVGPP